MGYATAMSDLKILIWPEPSKFFGNSQGSALSFPEREHLLSDREGTHDVARQIGRIDSMIAGENVLAGGPLGR